MARSKAFFKSQQQCTQGTVSVHPSSNLNSCPERLCEGKGQTLRKDDSRDRPLAIHLNYLCNYRRHTVARMGARSELDEKSPADNRNWSTITTLNVESGPFLPNPDPIPCKFWLESVVYNAITKKLVM